MDCTATCKVEYVIIGNICQILIRNHVCYRCLSISGQTYRISDSNILKTIVPNDFLCRLVDCYGYSTIYWRVIVCIGWYETYCEVVGTRNECLIELGIPLEYTFYFSFTTDKQILCECLSISDRLNSRPSIDKWLNSTNCNILRERCLLVFFALHSNSCDSHLTMFVDHKGIAFCVSNGRVGRCVVNICVSSGSKGNYICGVEIL